MANNIPEGDVFVAGRARERVIRLLEIADSLGVDQRTVRTANGGYIVPAAVGDAYEGQLSAESIAEEPEAPKAPAKKRAPRKTTKSE